MWQRQSGQAAGAQKFASVPRVPVPGMFAHAQTHVSTGENPAWMKLKDILNIFASVQSVQSFIMGWLHCVVIDPTNNVYILNSSSSITVKLVITGSMEAVFKKYYKTYTLLMDKNSMQHMNWVNWPNWQLQLHIQNTKIMKNTFITCAHAQYLGWRHGTGPGMGVQSKPETRHKIAS